VNTKTIGRVLVAAVLLFGACASCRDAKKGEPAGGGGGGMNMGGAVGMPGTGGASSGAGTGGVAAGSGGGDGAGGAGGAATGSGGGGGPLPALLTPRTAANLFLSGHSLINLDMPWNVSQLATANGVTHFYNEQMGIGSNLALRATGGNEQDQKGERINFVPLDEVRSAMTLPGGRKYDTLIITEASEINNQVISADTVTHAAAFYDAMIAGNASGRVFLYDSWDNSAGNVPAWITKTRRDYMWYECVASAINKTPARARNPMVLLPAGMMMARAAEAIQAGQIPGLSAASAILHTDGHHASDLGNYMLAITVYAAIYGKMPETSMVTPTGRFGRAYTGLPGAATITALRNLVWETLTTFYRTGHHNQRPMNECRQELAQRCGAIGTFVCNDRIKSVFAD
jgi:hypothetical protein